MSTNATLTHVNLTPVAVDAIRQVAGTTGMSYTDVINRAVLVYGLLSGAADHAGRLRVIRADGTPGIVALR